MCSVGSLVNSFGGFDVASLIFLLLNGLNVKFRRHRFAAEPYENIRIGHSYKDGTNLIKSGSTRSFAGGLKPRPRFPMKRRFCSCYSDSCAAGKSPCPASSAGRI